MGKLTRDEFIRRAKEKNEKIRNGDVEVLGEYASASDRIQCVCHIHNIVWHPFAASLYKGIGCKQCRTDAVTVARTKTNEGFQDELIILRANGRDIYTDDIYVNSRTKMLFYCSKNHKWFSTPNDILSGYGCPYCSGRNVIVGETSLWDTRPDVAELLADYNDGYRYSSGSDKKVDFVCPVCHTINKKIIGNVCRYGFVCQACSDKVSYPQKFARALLKQLPIVNIQYEYSPEWLKPYRFDAYFEYLGVKYALEMDGHLGHGNRKFGTNEEDIDGRIRDNIKNSLADLYNIQVIRIDCNYQMHERFEYVKYHILNSMLSVLFNLDSIDWLECDKQGQEKLVPRVAQLYNQGMSLQEICDIVGHCRRTIGRWLKQAKNIGLCDYNTQEAKTRGIRYARGLTIQN